MGLSVPITLETEMSDPSIADAVGALPMPPWALPTASSCTTLHWLSLGARGPAVSMGVGVWRLNASQELPLTND